MSESIIFPGGRLSPAEVGQLIGVTAQCVRKMARAGKLPGSKRLGGRIYFDKAVVMDWANNLPSLEDERKAAQREEA